MFIVCDKFSVLPNAVSLRRNVRANHFIAGANYNSPTEERWALCEEV